VISGFPTGVVMILCAVLTLWASAFAGIRAELRRLAGQGAVLRSIVASVIRACTRQLHISASPGDVTSPGLC